jgi:hypothetical protein
MSLLGAQGMGTEVGRFEAEALDEVAHEPLWRQPTGFLQGAIMNPKLDA